MDRSQAVLVCRHVFDELRPVNYVTRPDGDWCFLCGGDDDDSGNADSYRVVGVGHLIDRDPSLGKIMDLEANEEAERKRTTDSWKRSRF